jgi:wyosine [tRNA(Phe)-imidazoG37] synthetase (radical SAM superfamily)
VRYIFGPVPSRRLGLSLGIDLIPPKTCSFDCLYCQVGRTTCKTLAPRAFVPVDRVVEELKERLSETEPDTITLSGSGEPTLHSRIGEVIEAVKEMTEIKVAVLSNGSLFWRKEIRESILKADIILPTVSTASESTFQKIHRPHEKLNIKNIIEGLKRLRQEYSGQLYLEVMILAGINDTGEEVDGLKDVIQQISPEKIQINTVVRPPADPRARSVEDSRLEVIREVLGKDAEIVAGTPVKVPQGKGGPRRNALLEMVRRRPLGPLDIAKALRISPKEAEALVEDLVKMGYIKKQEHLGKLYYVSRERDERS